MSMKLEVFPESGFLRVHAVGEFSLEEARRTFLEMLEAVAEHKAGKVLFDGRAVAGSPETMERFYYGEFAARSVAEFVHANFANRHSHGDIHAAADIHTLCAALAHAAQPGLPARG